MPQYQYQSIFCGLRESYRYLICSHWGFATFGDAFGELALVDFSGPDSQLSMSRPANELGAIPFTDEKFLPMVGLPTSQNYDD